MKLYTDYGMVEGTVEEIRALLEGSNNPEKWREDNFMSWKEAIDELVKGNVGLGEYTRNIHTGTILKRKVVFYQGSYMVAWIDTLGSIHGSVHDDTLDLEFMQPLDKDFKECEEEEELLKYRKLSESNEDLYNYVKEEVPKWKVVRDKIQ